MENKYGKVSKSIIERLKALIGEQNVSTEEEEKERYSCDEMSIPRPHFPEVIVKPQDTSSVLQVLALANEKRIPVTPRGGGTGLCGGCVPIFGGILLSLERMNRVLEVDEENFTATVEAGVLLEELYKVVERCGLYYPLYPGERTATIGGNVATNAGGMRAVKYGVTRNFVLGLEAVTPQAKLINVGGKFVKNSTGYNLLQLLIGSEGTLAITTKVTLRLIVTPDKREILFIPFNRMEDAIKSVPQILKHRIQPVGIEFMEREIIETAERFTNIKLPFHEYEAFLLLILEGNKEDEIFEACECIGEIVMKNGAVDVFLPRGEKAKRELLEVREKLYPALKHLGFIQVIDVVVPRSKIAIFIEKVKQISRKHQIPVLAFGHAGDGNIHLHPLGKNMSKEEWERKIPLILKDIYQEGASLGGQISGEHGIGFEKKSYLSITTDTDIITLMKGVKLAFDPKNILNPGKIFDLE